jgi:hypothetical protein
MQQLLDSHLSIHAGIIAEVDLAISTLADDRDDPVLASQQRIGTEHDGKILPMMMGHDPWVSPSSETNSNGSQYSMIR